MLPFFNMSFFFNFQQASPANFAPSIEQEQQVAGWQIQHPAQKILRPN
jgi:hypothetical protein